MVHMFKCFRLMLVLNNTFYHFDALQFASAFYFESDELSCALYVLAPYSIRIPCMTILRQVTYIQ